jgi:hypothetical protein
VAGELLPAGRAAGAEEERLREVTVNVQVSGVGQVPVRRLAGIDLGIASEHTVRVLDGAGNKVCAARCVPTRESLLAMEARALAGTSAGTRLDRSYVIQGMRMLAVTWANATRGKSVFWLHATVRRGHLAAR